MGASATRSTGACSYRFSSHDFPRSALSGTLPRSTFGRRTLAPRLSVKAPDGLRDIRTSSSTSVGSLRQRRPSTTISRSSCRLSMVECYFVCPVSRFRPSKQSPFKKDSLRADMISFPSAISA